MSDMNSAGRWEDGRFYPLRWMIIEQGVAHDCFVVESRPDGTFTVEGYPIEMATASVDWIGTLEMLSLGIRALDNTLLLRLCVLGSLFIWDGVLHDLDHPLIKVFEGLAEAAYADLMTD